MPVTRRALFKKLAKSWWLTLYAIWGFLGGADLAVTKYGSAAAKEHWDRYWVISRPSHLIITLLVFTIIFLFERAYREIKKSSYDQDAEFRKKLHVIAGCQTEADDLLDRTPPEKSTAEVCSQWNADVGKWIEQTREKLKSSIGQAAAARFNTSYIVTEESYPGFATTCYHSIQRLNFRKLQLQQITEQAKVFLPNSPSTLRS